MPAISLICTRTSSCTAVTHAVQQIRLSPPASAHCRRSFHRRPSIAMSTVALPIGITGTFTLRVDATTRPRTIAAQHSYTFDASTVTAANAAAPAATPAPAASAATSAPPAVPARVTANTFATHPSDIPRSCATEPTLATLVQIINQAKEESDRFLTLTLDDMKRQRQCSAHTRRARTGSLALHSTSLSLYPAR